MIFIYTMYMVITRDWCTTHVGYISIHTCVLVMKMHSYTVMNRDLRKNYLESVRRETNPLSIYPQNITLRDFTLFMWMPVLVYECSYPRWPEKRRYGYIIKKCIFAIGLIFLQYILMSDYVIPYI